MFLPELKQDDVKMTDWNSPSSVFDLPMTKTHFPFNQLKKDPSSSSAQDLLNQSHNDTLDLSGNDSILSGDLSGDPLRRPSRTKIKTSRAAAWEQERLQSSSGRSNRKRDQSASDGDEEMKHAKEETGEKTYCVCNQVSFGNMIACEMDGCAIEWFHYECVGITEAPKGKWYCGECREKLSGVAGGDDKKDKRRNHYR